MRKSLISKIGILLLPITCYLLPAYAGGIKYETIKVTDAPFKMPEFKVPVFPDRNFDITKYGATLDSPSTHQDSVRVANSNSAAILKAMEACCKAGGGHVVIPDGTWLTGPIHFRSNCDLHLGDNAKITFCDSPECYLPAVETTWEGMECMNYSPLVYAFQCKDIGISGKGCFAPVMNTWKAYFKRTPVQMQIEFQLYDWASTDYPVAQRFVAPSAAADNQEALAMNHEPSSILRPQLIQFSQCEGIVLEDFKIRNSPFWTTHIYRCENVVMRGVDSYAHGHNNDGVDIEMTQNVLIENCTFDQGDDGVVIKAGRNQDAWRIGRPTKNVVIRHCDIKNAHGMLVVGSEISGGIYNVWMHDCHSDGKMFNFCYIKTNNRRGATIDGIWMNDCSAGSVDRMFAIDTDILYQWKNAKTYKEALTTIQNIHVSNLKCQTVNKGMVNINGDARLPVHDVTVENLSCEVNKGYVTKNNNVKNYEEKNIISPDNDAK